MFNNAMARFWNEFYNTAKSIGCTNTEAARFADVQLEKLV